MARIAGIVFFGLVAVSVATILATSSALPARVASHFAADGRANGWLSHDGYVVSMLAFGVLVPCVVALSIGWLPRRFPRFVNLRPREYWLAPQRREATLASLATLGYAIGGLTMLFVLGMHLAVVEANAAAPPRLASGHLIALFVLFVASIVAIIAGVHRRFAMPR